MTNDDLERLELPEPVAFLVEVEGAPVYDKIVRRLDVAENYRDQLNRDYAWRDVSIVELLSADQIRALLADRQRRAQAAEPVGYVNGDELDNMLDDRTATIGPESNWRKTPLYRAAPAEVTEEITLAMEVRAAKALHRSQYYDPWDDAPMERKEWFRKQAKIVLEAALGGGHGD